MYIYTGIKYLCQNDRQQLDYLELSFCHNKNLTLNSLLIIANQCPNIELIDFDGL